MYTAILLSIINSTNVGSVYMHDDVSCKNWEICLRFTHLFYLVMVVVLCVIPSFVHSFYSFCNSFYLEQHSLLLPDQSMNISVSMACILTHGFCLTLHA